MLSDARKAKERANRYASPARALASNDLGYDANTHEQRHEARKIGTEFELHCDQSPLMSPAQQEAAVEGAREGIERGSEWASVPRLALSSIIDQQPPSSSTDASTGNVSHAGAATINAVLRHATAPMPATIHSKSVTAGSQDDEGRVSARGKKSISEELKIVWKGKIGDKRGEEKKEQAKEDELEYVEEERRAIKLRAQARVDRQWAGQSMCLLFCRK